MLLRTLNMMRQLSIFETMKDLLFHGESSRTFSGEGILNMIVI